MKKTINIILTCVALLFAFACTKPENTAVVNEDGSVDIFAVIDLENGTKATLNDVSGAFTFTRGDAIVIGTSRGAFTGSNDFDDNSPFDKEHFRVYGLRNTSDEGIAAYPAENVTAISNSSVTFSLPRSYTYDDVGNSNPDDCKTPVPMLGLFDGTISNKVTFKQAGSVVRFQVTEIAEGSLTFTFPTKVTGQVTLSSPSPYSWASNTSTGILAANLSLAGNSITVTDVPAVAKNNYIYITLPVPTGTAPHEIMVTNTPADGSLYKQIALTGSSTALSRAGGYKITVTNPTTTTIHPFIVYHDTEGVNPDRYVVFAPGNLMAKIASISSPTATASEWKFGEAFEVGGENTTDGNYLLMKGRAECVGKWVDLFSFQGASATYHVHGLTNNSYNAEYHGRDSESLYTGCWETDATNGYTSGYIHIENGGENKWRPLTKQEWAYLFNSRTGATISSSSGWRYSRATVAGMKGLLIFPDGLDWATSLSSITVPTDKNPKKETYDFVRSYTASEFAAMQAVGIVFLPSAGYRNGSELLNVAKWGYYWSSTGASGSQAYRASFNNSDTVTCEDTSIPYDRACNRSVRLVREVTP